MVATSDNALEDIALRGMQHFSAMSDAEFRSLISQLGRPWCETVVELRPNVRSYLCRAEPVPFHTDHPDADLIAWRCERQDVTDGEQLFVDGLAALLACGPDVRETLTRVHVEVRVRAESPPSIVPIVRSRSGMDRLCFAEWIKPIEQDDASVEAFETLKRQVVARKENAIEAVRLAEGEALVVDNGRWLHGRASLSPTSCRRLTRLWITR